MDRATIKFNEAHSSFSESSINKKRSTLVIDNIKVQRDASTNGAKTVCSCSEVFKQMSESRFGQRYVLRRKNCSDDKCASKSNSQTSDLMKNEPNKKDTAAVDLNKNHSEGHSLKKCKSSELLAQTSPGFVKNATKIWENIISAAKRNPTQGKI